MDAPIPECGPGKGPRAGSALRAAPLSPSLFLESLATVMRNEGYVSKKKEKQTLETISSF